MNNKTLKGLGILLLIAAFLYAGFEGLVSDRANNSKVYPAEVYAEEPENSPVPTGNPTLQPEPTATAVPTVTPAVQPTAAPEATTQATTANITVEPTTAQNIPVQKKPKQKIAKPKIKRIDAYENSVQKIYWTGDNKADYYLVFRKEQGGKYKQIAKTKKLMYTDKKGRGGRYYYYRIQAVMSETRVSARSFSSKSKPVKKLCRKKPARVAYIGDSVMSGFAAYGALNSNERSFAKVSLFVQQIKSTFLGSVNAYKPDRVYIMCGTNNCVGIQSQAYLNGVRNDYAYVVDSIHKANPKCEIVIMGVGNTRSSRVPNATVNSFNRLLKGIADTRSYAVYFNTGAYINDGSGSLSQAYSAGDGIHWSSAAYRAVHARLLEFMKVL